MKNKRRSMTDISRAISENNKKKPSNEKIEELFNILEQEGLTNTTDIAEEKSKIIKGVKQWKLNQSS